MAGRRDTLEPHQDRRFSAAGTPHLSASPSSPFTAIELSISIQAEVYRKFLQTLYRDLSDDDNADESANTTAVYNAVGRLSIWGKNLGAFRRADSRSSIDWRLCKAEKMRTRVQDILDELSRNAGRGLHHHFPSHGLTRSPPVSDSVPADRSLAQAISEGRFKNTDLSDLNGVMRSLDATNEEEIELI